MLVSLKCSSIVLLIKFILLNFESLNFATFKASILGSMQSIFFTLLTKNSDHLPDPHPASKPIEFLLILSNGKILK